MLTTIIIGIILSMSMWLLQKNRLKIIAISLWKLIGIVVISLIIVIIICALIGPKSYFVIAIATIFASNSLIINYQETRLKR